MKLLYFLSLGLLLSLNSLTQADNTDPIRAEPQIELQGEQQKNEQPVEALAILITELPAEALPIQITEQSKEALAKRKKEKELSLCCAVKGGLSAVAAVAALSAAVINAHDASYGNVKLPTWDKSRVYGTSLALFYVSAQASRSAYNAFFKGR